MHKPEPEELENRLELSERKRMQLQKRLRQRTVEEEIPLWSMVDLMTVLLIFFLFLYTTTVKGPLSTSQDPPREGFSQQTESSTSDLHREEADGKIPIETGSAPSPVGPLPSESEQLAQTMEQLQEEVLATIDEGDRDVFSVSSDQRRLVFTLGERITFKEGQATLLESYQPIFARIADFISSKPDYQVVVSGHTDNKPIRTEQFSSNLELPSVRAITVARFLMRNGVARHRVSIQGFSEYRPLFENVSPENRQRNRRVEIALIREQRRG